MHVLERLGLLVDAVPRHAEVLGEVELEQAVVAHDLERDALAVVGQLDALVGRVLDEPALGELLDHPEADGGVTPSRSASALVETAPSPRRCSA